MRTADRLRFLIEQKHISYYELSRLSGVPKSAIQRYATGKSVKIPLDRFFRIAEALGVSPYEVIGDDRPFGEDKDFGVEYAKYDFSQSPLPPDDPWTLRQEEREDPDRKALFMLSKYGSAKDIRQVNALIDALKATNPDFYDGDDPA